MSTTQNQTAEHQATDAPTTAKEAYDQALAALTDDERTEYRQRAVQATRAGMPQPMPPGYQPPSPPEASEAERAADTEQHAAQIAELEAQIAEAMAEGDWTRSRHLKGEYVSRRNAALRNDANGGGQWYGAEGPR